MKQKQIRIILKEILINKLGVSNSEVTDESFIGELGADGIDEIEIVVDLEREIGFNIPDNITLEFQSFGSFCNSIENMPIKEVSEI